MEYRDYYGLLGVPKSATNQEIRAAYRKLAQVYHPDHNRGDVRATEKFKDINEAYEVLSDPARREKYDRLGATFNRWQRTGQPGGFDFAGWAARQAERAQRQSTGGQAQGQRPGQAQGQAAPGPGTGPDLGDLFGRAGFSEFFDILFGRAASGQGPAGRSAGPQKGAGGARPGEAQGAFRMPGADMEQPIDISLEEAYAGARRTLQRGDRRLSVNIPPGARTGTRVRLAGAGAEADRPGDLYLVVNVRPHPTFRREGDDLHVDLAVDLYTALLGGELPVPTPAGQAVSLTIPPESQPGRVLCLPGRGMPRLRTPSQAGDLLAHLVVQLPTQLTEREKQLFAQLRALRPAPAQAGGPAHAKPA